MLNEPDNEVDPKDIPNHNMKILDYMIQNYTNMIDLK